MSGKRYPEEFKIEAVKQVVDRGHSVSSVATRLDITTHSLGNDSNLLIVFYVQIVPDDFVMQLHRF